MGARALLERARSVAETRFWPLVGVVGLLYVLVMTAYCLKLGSSVRYFDERSYLAIARGLARHGHFSLDGHSPTAFRPPAWPMVLAVGYWLHLSVAGLRGVNVLFGLWSIASAAILGRRLTSSELGGVLAGALCAFYPLSIYTAATFYPETMVSALVLGALVLVSGRFSVWRAGAAGVLLGVGCLAVATTAVVGVMVAAWLVVRRVGWRAVAIFCLAGVSLVGAWTVRNQVVLHAIVPVADNSGLNLLLGNSPHTTARSGVNVDISSYERYVAEHHLGEVATSSWYTSQALAWIGAHPVRAGVLYVEKTLNYFAPFDALATKGEQSSGRDALAATSYLPMLGLAAWGQWRRRRRRSELEKVLLTVYLGMAPVLAVYFTRVRFRSVFDPLMLLLAVVSAGELLTGMRDSLEVHASSRSEVV
jgi:hypothetical protein